LDAKLRVGMRAQLAALHTRLATTTIYVTHDQVEAMTLGQRVAVMRDGRVLQMDTPQALYARPVNLFVAAFIGSPAMKLVEASVGDGVVEFAGSRSRTHPTSAARSWASGRRRSRTLRSPTRRCRGSRSRWRWSRTSVPTPTSSFRWTLRRST